MKYTSDLKSILGRLAKSAGRRIARRNALADLDVLLARIRREVRREYPAISKSGQEVRVTELPFGQKSCPACGIHVTTYGDLAGHMVAKHDGKCFCGFRPMARWSRRYSSSLPRDLAKTEQADKLREHLKRVVDVTTHATVSVIGQSPTGEQVNALLEGSCVMTTEPKVKGGWK